MQYRINVPLCYLQAVRLFTAKKDVRYYLQGVAIKDGYLMGSNGSYIGAMFANGIDRTLPEIIIPNEAIDFYVKKAGRSTVKDVEIQWDDERNVVMGNGMHVEHCKGIDGKFPDLMRAVPTHVVAPGETTQFPWYQLALFEKAAEVLGQSKTLLHKAYLLPDGPDRAGRVVLPSYPDFIGAIMPLKSQDIDLRSAAGSEQV